MLRQYFNRIETLEIVLKFFCNVLWYVGTKPEDVDVLVRIYCKRPSETSKNIRFAHLAYICRNVPDSRVDRKSFPGHNHYHLPTEIRSHDFPGYPISDKDSRVHKIVESPGVDGALPRTMAGRSRRAIFIVCHPSFYRSRDTLLSELDSNDRTWHPTLVTIAMRLFLSKFSGHPVSPWRFRELRLCMQFHCHWVAVISSQ